MDRLNKLLNIRPNEWSRLLFIFAILIFANVGTSWATSATYATITQTIGEQVVMWVLFSSAILSILFMFVYTAFVDRVDNNRLFAYIVALGGGLKLISLILTRFFREPLVFLVLHILSEVWLAAWGAQFATYVNDLFDIQSSKRTWPIILAAASIGGILGGFSQKILQSNNVSVSTIIWIWLATDIITFGILWVMPIFIKGHKKFSKDTAKAGKPLAQKESTSYVQSLKDGLKFTLQSGLLRWMAIGTLLLMALMSSMEYYSNSILDDRPDYMSYLGTLKGYSGVVGLIILFFAVGWMTRSWGVKNTSLTFPVLTVLMGGAIFAVGAGPLAALTASLAFVTRKGIRSGFQETIDGLFFNAVPLRIKGRARAFVGGMVTPLGTMLGVFLLWVLGKSDRWLPIVIAVLALIYLASMIVTRHQYTQALVTMLEEEDYSFLLSESSSSLNVADPATLVRLQKKLEESASHEMRVFMTQLIAQVGGAESLSILIPAINTTNEARTRAAMLNVLSAAGLQGDKIRELYTGFLADSDPYVRQAAASGLEQLLGSKDAWLQAQWLKMVNDRHRSVSLYALQSLAGAGDFYKFEPAVQKLDQLLDGNSVEDKKNAIDILGIIAQPKAVERLLSFLADTDNQIRLEAVLELEKLPLPFGGALDDRVLETTQPLLSDSVARVRQAALQVVSKFRDRKIHPLLISALADQNSQVCSTAVDILVGMGKEIAPVVQAELNSPSHQTHKMATVILSRINPRQFGALIEKVVADNLNNIYQNISLEQAFLPYKEHHSVRIQLAVLRESNHHLIDEILYFLSAVHDPQVLAVIGESLHSESSETRNLALEALESLTSPQTAALIASLFEPSLAPLQLLQLGKESALNVEQVDIVRALENILTQTESRFLSLLALAVTKDVAADLISNPSGRAELVSKVHPVLEKLLSHSDAQLQQAAQEAVAVFSEAPLEIVEQKEKTLSVIEKMSVLKEVPFFRNVPISQLENLAVECQEKRYKKDTRLFRSGETGSSLYIVVEGQVGIQQERRGGSALLATLEDNSYFGEMAMFENNVRSASAVVLKDNSLLMEVERAPVFTLTVQNPALAFELINVLSQRIRETSDRLSDTARARPRELHKLFDQFG